MFAASIGDCNIVKLLLEYNASINDFASPHDWNPLCCALQANNKEVARVLLDVESLTLLAGGVFDSCAAKIGQFRDSRDSRLSIASARYMREGGFHHTVVLTVWHE